MSNDEYKAGRPFLFTDPKDLDLKIQNYFDNRDPHIEKRRVENGVNQQGQMTWIEREIMTKQRPYTVTGLARHLGVARTTLNNYRDPNHYSEDIDDEIRQQIMFSIENAVQRVEEYNEENLHTTGSTNGVKFNLSNNFGWIDKKVVDENVRTIGEALDELDDPKEQRDDVAAQAAAQLKKTDEQAGSETKE